MGNCTSLGVAVGTHCPNAYLHSLWGLAKSRSVHSLMLSSRLFCYCCCCCCCCCLPCRLLPPFTVHCKMVLTRPQERETRPYHCSLRLFMMVLANPGGDRSGMTWLLVSLMLTQGQSTIRRSPSLSRSNTWPLNASAHLALGK